MSEFPFDTLRDPCCSKSKIFEVFFLAQSFFFFLLALFTVFLREKLKVEELYTAEKSSLSGKHPTLYYSQTVTWKNTHTDDDNGKDPLTSKQGMYVQNLYNKNALK